VREKIIMSRRETSDETASHYGGAAPSGAPSERTVPTYSDITGFSHDRWRKGWTMPSPAGAVHLGIGKN
jgi:hypothetical protein